MHLGHVAEELQHRLQHIFAKGDDGRRACNDGNDKLDYDQHWANYLWFHEFFDGDTGRGLGASHQTGWTGLIAKMIHDSGVNCRLPHTPRTPASGMSHYFDETWSKTRPKRHIGSRRMSTRSIAGRSDIESEADDDEDEKQRDIDDRRVLDYVSGQLQRVKSYDTPFDFDPNEGENEFEAQADNGPGTWKMRNGAGTQADNGSGTWRTANGFH